jgi:hypothetical protein
MLRGAGKRRGRSDICPCWVKKIKIKERKYAKYYFQKLNIFKRNILPPRII